MTTHFFTTILLIMIGFAADGPDRQSPVQPSSMRQTGVLSHFNVNDATTRELPKRLREISGLAMTDDNRLLAHNDERGIIYEIDYKTGSIVKEWRLTDLSKPVADDFEGIAVVDDRVYLVTSSGRLYECGEGADGQNVLFNMYTTGIGRRCEIEGLAFDPDRRMLLLMCKNPRSPDSEGLLSIFRWSVDTKELVEDARTVIPVGDFSEHIEGDTFQPSGIERHPESGNYVIVAARQQAIAEVSPEGQVITVIALPDGRHPQAEGITITSNNTLIIADEGKDKRATLTLYPGSGG